MRTTRTPVAPRSRRPAVAGIRRPVSKVEKPVAPDPVDANATGDTSDPEAAVTVEPNATESDDSDPTTAEAGESDPATAKAGESEPATAKADPTASTAEPATAARTPKSTLLALRFPIALLITATLLVGGGVWAMIRADHLTANTNVALVDTAGTAEVTRQVRDGLEKIFSYQYDNTQATEEAAKNVLTGPASDQYNRLFNQVRQQAPAQKLTLTTQVVHSGVVSLTNDTATLLVFLDQSATRGDTGETTTAGAQLSVTAVHSDGTWKISDLIPR